MNKFSITKSVQAFLPMIVVFAWDNIINNPLGLYGIWPKLDVPMHLLGGVVTVWSIKRLFASFPTKWRPVIRPVWAHYFFWLGLVALVTIGWEIYEVIFDYFHPFPTPMTLADTLGDMVNGLLGAAGFLLIEYRVQRARLTTKVVKGREKSRGKKTVDQVA